MIVGRDRFEEVYATIRQAACAGGAQTVLVLVAPDCDAVCGAHILARLLKDDNVPHKTQPVAGYDDVRAALSDVAGDERSEVRPAERNRSSVGPRLCDLRDDDRRGKTSSTISTENDGGSRRSGPSCS